MKKKLLQLFLSTLKLSACTFGGGFVIIPLLRRKFVEELHWIDENEMMDYTAIAQSSPGAIAVNASILIGFHVAGIPGIITSVLGTVIPPVAIISVISFFYQAFRDHYLVAALMSGMLAGVAAVVCDVVISMTKTLVRQKKPVYITLLVLAFIAARFLNLSIAVILVVCGLIGLITEHQHKHQERIVHDLP